MSSEAFYEKCRATGIIRKEEMVGVLSAADREIALKAIAGRATGKPVDAAVEILAGIAVLNGNRLPILVWPAGTTREEKAAWHKSEAASWEESAQRFAKIMSAMPSQQSVEQTPALSPIAEQLQERAQPLLDSASFAQARPAAETENHPLPQSPGHALGASDAC